MNLKEINKRISNFLGQLDTEVDVDYFATSIDYLDFDNAFESIYQEIQDNNGFEQEIIYHHRAIEYLRENDPSLQESLGIADEYGFELSVLNSETLASLLATREAKDDFRLLETEIDEFFSKLKEEIQGFIEELEDLEKLTEKQEEDLEDLSNLIV